MTILIPSAALFIAVASLIGSQLISVRTLRQAADQALVDEQSKRIDNLQTEVEACQRSRAELQKQLSKLKDENFELMRRLMQIERNAP